MHMCAYDEEYVKGTIYWGLCYKCLEGTIADKAAISHSHEELVSAYPT